jgi:SAM-dependent methyltransferase
MEPARSADDPRAEQRSRRGARGDAHGGGAGARPPARRLPDRRAGLRDPMLVERILERHAVRPGLKPVLDVPCGSGRLRGVLERRGIRWVGADATVAALGEAAGEAGSPQVVADAQRLPFADDSFDVVVCCRLLHHLRDADELEAVVAELVRVSARLVVASFWDSASLHAWRRRVGLRRAEGPRARRAVSKRALRRVFEENGAEVLDFHHSFRFISQQTFAVAVKRAVVGARAPSARRARIRLFDLDLPRAPESLGPAGS